MKIKEIKIREDDGSYSDPIPMGADAINIDIKNGNNLQEEINTINNDIKNLQDLSTFENTIFVGDSYAVGQNSTDNKGGWAARLKNLLGLTSNVNCWFAMLGGSGFIGLPNVSNFQTLLKDSLEYVPEPSNIKKIIVCGGYNDNSYTQEQINTKIIDFINYSKTVYPNATIYIGMIARCTLKSETGNTVRKNLGNQVLFRYSQSIAHGAVYLNGVENILKQNYLMGEDGIHPTNGGYDALAQGIRQALITGSYTSSKYETWVNLTGDNLSKQTSYNFNSNMCNNIVKLYGFLQLYFINPIDITYDSELCNISLPFGYVQNNFYFLASAILALDDNTEINKVIPIHITNDQKLKADLRFSNINGRKCKGITLEGINWDISTQYL